MPTTNQDISFAEKMQKSVVAVVSTSSLDNAIQWMQQNLEPEDIFSEKQLSNWAEANGYVKE